MDTTISKDYVMWDTLKEKYPDSFVLLENPVYEPEYSPFLKKGIFIYKNKSQKKVYEKAAELRLNYLTIRYTGGIRVDNINENALIL